MNWASGALVFIIIWWTVIFIVLPWGLKRDERGIPQNLNLKKKIVTITGISAILWVIVYGLVTADVVDFRQISKTMAQEDYGS